MESVCLQIGNSFINQSFTKTEVYNLLVAHKEIKYKREQFRQDEFKIGDKTIYIYYHNGLQFTSIDIEFEGEQIKSMERTTKEFHVFELNA